MAGVNGSIVGVLSMPMTTCLLLRVDSVQHSLSIPECSAPLSECFHKLAITQCLFYLHRG